jgi:hypothetical protein
VPPPAKAKAQQQLLVPKIKAKSSSSQAPSAVQQLLYPTITPYSAELQAPPPPQQLLHPTVKIPKFVPAKYGPNTGAMPKAAATTAAPRVIPPSRGTGKPMEKDLIATSQPLIQ